MTRPVSSFLPPATISAVVLTLNEETNLERCLHSLAWADMLTIVDSGSQDRTIELARSLGARVIEHISEGPFQIAEQRNWALTHGEFTTDWVLFLDADEEATPDLAAEIRRRCCGREGPNAYQLAPKYIFRGRWMRRTMRYPAWHDRLVRRDGVSFDGGVWEHFSPGTKIGRIREPYMHHGNSKGFEDWLERHGRYSSWDAQSIAAYRATADVSSFATTRRLRSRRLGAALLPLRPLARFVLMYIVRRGFLDGPEAFAFCLRYAIYDYMTVEKVIEISRRQSGLPL